MRFLKKQKKEKQTKKLDQFLTYKKANLGPVFSFTAIFYVLGKSCPKNAEKHGIFVFLFARFSFGCFRTWQPLPQVGVMKTIFCFGNQYRTELQHLFLVGRERA